MIIQKREIAPRFSQDLTHLKRQTIYESNIPVINPAIPAIRECLILKIGRLLFLSIQKPRFFSSQRKESGVFQIVRAHRKPILLLADIPVLPFLAVIR